MGKNPFLDSCWWFEGLGVSNLNSTWNIGAVTQEEIDFGLWSIQGKSVFDFECQFRSTPRATVLDLYETYDLSMDCCTKCLHEIIYFKKTNETIINGILTLLSLQGATNLIFWNSYTKKQRYLSNPHLLFLQGQNVVICGKTLCFEIFEILIQKLKLYF